MTDSRVSAIISSERHPPWGRASGALMVRFCEIGNGPGSSFATAFPPPNKLPASAPEPQVVLGRFADATGNIDGQKLNCGQLADASPGEADVFLAWYSGWYNGAAKKRGINLARIRTASRMVIDYCKSNRDKKIVQVMDLMLK